MTFAHYPSLKNRVVFVTGGGSGIGAAIVETFAAQGASVAFVDIAEAESQALAERLAGAPKPPLFLKCDVTDIGALEAALETARERLGPMSVLINNAANDARQSIDDVTEADWDRAMAVNLKHQFFAARAAWRQMRGAGAGSIVNLTSIIWRLGQPRVAAYSTAKAAILGLTNSLAREFGRDGVRVNAIAPGAVMTERQRRLWLSEGDSKAIVARQCLHRALVAEDVARMALFLAADDSAGVTKQCFTVDGGLL